MSLEQELSEATKVSASKYDDRQEYLAAVVMAVNKFKQGQYEDLSDEAVDWFNHNVPKLKAKMELDDFDDFDEASEGEEASEDEEAPEDEEVDDDADTDEEDTEPEDVGEAEGEGEDEDDSDQADDEAGEESASDDEDHEAEAEAEAENEAMEAEAAKTAPKAKGGKAPAKAKAAAPAKEKPKEKPKVVAKYGSKPKPKPKHIPREVIQDRFGCFEGTITSKVVAMYARPNGATAAQIMDATGGRHYNILKTLAQRGHHVEKHEGGVFKLIHKDDYAKKAKGKK